jgi:hypothetical protein
VKLTWSFLKNNFPTFSHAQRMIRRYDLGFFVYVFALLTSLRLPETSPPVFSFTIADWRLAPILLGDMRTAQKSF